MQGAAPLSIKKTIGPPLIKQVKTSSSAKVMENIWQTAKRILLIEEAKKRSDAAHAYLLEIGKRQNKPPPNKLQQYLIPPCRPNTYQLLRQRETGTYLTTGGRETLIHLIESSLPTLESKTQDIKDEELFDIFFNCCQLPRHSWKHVNHALEIATQNCRSTSLPNLRELEATSTPHPE